MLLFAGCNRSEYTNLVKRELAKGVRNDSLLLGIHLGDTQQDFLDKCKALNLAHIVTEGSGDGSVRFPLIDSIFHQQPEPISLLFKPKYDESRKIIAMNCRLSYVGWAPWNSQLQSDSLNGKSLKIFERWYGGNKFIPVTVNNQPMSVKVDGNRQILAYTFDKQVVIIEIQDLLSPAFSVIGESKK